MVSPTSTNAHLISTAEAAARYGVHPDTIRVRVKAGEIPVSKIGRIWRFDPAVLDRLFAKAGTTPPERHDARRRS